MVKNNKFIQLIIMAIILIIPLSVTTAEEGGVIMTLKDNEYQDSETSSWFNLDTSGVKDKEIELGVEFTNMFNEEKTVVLEKTNVITVQNGGLDFVNETKNKYTGSLDDKILLKDNITEFPEELTIKEKETKELKFRLKVPKEDGQYLVGIAYYIKDQEKDNDDKSEGAIQIKQRLRYATPILMTNSSLPNKELDVKGVEVNTEGGKPRVLISLENNNTMLESSIIEYKVIRKSDNETVFEGETNMFLMAPHTYIKYPLTWMGDVSMGEYTIKINLKQKIDGDEYTSFKHNFDFELADEDIKKIEFEDPERIVYKDQVPGWIWYLVGALGVSFVTLLILFFKKRKDEENKEEKSD